MDFDAKTDPRATTVSPNDVLPFGDVSADGWDTITLTSFLSSLSLVTGAGGPQPAQDPGAAAFLDVAVLRADDIAGNDGDSVNTWTPTRGNAAAFAAVTSSPTIGAPKLKKAGNGINGHNAVRFQDLQIMHAATGAASLTGAFYCAYIVSGDNVGGALMSIVTWGDRSGTSAQRKCLFTPGTSGTATVYFSGASNDLSTGVGPAAATPALIEFSYAGGAGGTLNVYLNGALIGSAAKTLATFTAPQLVLSGRPYDSQAAADYQERYTGLLAEVWLASAVPTTEQLAGLRAYAAARYGVALVDGGAALAAFDATNAVHESASFKQLAGYGLATSLTVGGSTRLTTGGLGTTAALSVTGAVAASGTTVEHKFRNAYPLRNALWLQNTDPSGYSAVNCQASDSADNSEDRGCAFGWGNHTVVATVFLDCGYTEVSDLRAASNGVNPQAYRIIQTERANGSYRRIEVSASGAVKVFRRDAEYPDEGLALYTGVTAVSVANDATLDTEIVTGSVVCGQVIVRDATNSKCAVYRLENATLTAVSADGEFSTAQGTGSKVNVYANSGVIRLENKTGGALSLAASFYS